MKQGEAAGRQRETNSMCIIEDHGEEVPVRETVGQSETYGRRR